MPQETPLTHLCAICHLHTPKYTCPRCSTHTCSLPCVRRHKTTAPCTGVRDPAAYVRRKELATETGIDRDFNFIAGLERDVRRREDKMGELVGVGAPLGGSRERKTKFEMEVEERGMRIVRAPMGLVRRKQNKGVWKGGVLLWTVEWVAYTGEKRIQNYAEGKGVRESFLVSFGKKGLERKRKREDDVGSGVEQRRGSVEEGNRVEKDGRASDEGKVASLPAPTAVNDTPLKPSPEDTPKSTNTIPNSPSEPHFYLHRPLTTSKLKVLIPISPSSTWKEVLKGRTLLEHPTIYIREEGPEDLPKPFVLENEYLKVHGEDVVVLSEARVENTTKEQDPLQTVLDGGEILEVLKADLT